MRILNRDVIKYIAMFTMLLNHAATIFLKEGPEAAALIYIGNFTAVTMCYFLVEGYHYTSSKKRYGQRLLLFAVISQFPFTLAFLRGRELESTGLNMIFTLFICFLILLAMEKIPGKAERVVAVGALVCASVYCDWAILAAVFTIFFELGRDSRRKTAVAFGAAAVFDWLIALSSGLWEGESPEAAMAGGLMDCAAIFVSGVVILYLYNGKKSVGGQKFSKWFFYIFYPLHLLILGIIRILLL